MTAVGLAPAMAASPAPVGLGTTATSFAVLAGSTVTNTGPTVINGNLGLSPGTAVTGFPPGTVNGVIHTADAVAAQAQSDLTIAFNDAASRSADAIISTDLGGQTLVPGVYSGVTLGLTGTLTLNAQGDPSAVFIFQSSSTFIAAANSSILLINGASACNVFFQIGSSATFGTTATLIGTFLVQESITANTGAQVAGRLLARSSAVTLDSNRVSVPNCITAVAPTPTPSVSPSASPSGSPSASPSASPTGTVTASPTGTSPAATSTATLTPSPSSPASPTAAVPGPAAPVPNTGSTPPPDVSTAPAPASALPDTVTADSTSGSAQVTRVPTGGVQAGGGTPSTVQQPALLGTGLVLLLAAAFTGTRRRTGQSASHEV